MGTLADPVLFFVTRLYRSTSVQRQYNVPAAPVMSHPTSKRHAQTACEYIFFQFKYNISIFFAKHDGHKNQ